MKDESIAQLSAIYAQRWSAKEQANLRQVWQVLVKGFFQKFIQTDGPLLDVGAGFCHFINAAQAPEKIALDANPDIRRFANPDVKVVISSDLTLREIADQSLATVFVSNVLEHLASPDAVIDLLRLLRQKIKPQGSLLILQPNFRYVGAAYFDFIDHRVVLTEKSLAEALESTGYRITYMKKRFLPYTSKSSLPKAPWLVKLYLMLPFLHLFFGQQTFVVAQPQA